MDALAFIAKWKRTTLSERSSSHQHFLDLCDLLGHAKPADVDPTGSWFTFERGVTKTGGGKGWADVWKRGYFAWEYKGKHKDLVEAYTQLLRYREALENPPLLIVSDIDRFEIHTNFTATAKQKHEFRLEQIADPSHLQLLQKAFHDPMALEPGLTRKAVTEEVVERFGQLGERIWGRGVSEQQGAQFLMRLMFCMFAEDIDLLPDQVFTKVLTNFRRWPARLAKRLRALFKKMEKGGAFGPERILHFNGGLFADPSAIELTPEEIDELVRINECDWSNVEPSIFGTLFERTIDPNKRHQVGMHYTGMDDIKAVLDPVVKEPLRREWEQTKARCEQLWKEIEKNMSVPGKPGRRTKPSKHRQEFDKLLLDFVERLSEATILDPACGSGNFLYVALNLLLELEKEVITYASNHSTNVLPHVTPKQLAGLESNRYAVELARVVIWIGYLQWKYQNGFSPIKKPVLDPVEKIYCTDAILDLADPDNPKEPEWPRCEFIVGNPPFLGGSKIRRGHGDSYTDALFSLYEGRVPAFADLCCYWFEKARRQIGDESSKRAGLLATQGVRGGASREVLKRIKETGDIFFAESDRPWILDGASVHVSMVGFDNGEETERGLNGQHVKVINTNLTPDMDVTAARRLRPNLDLWCYGSQQKANFDLPPEVAVPMLSAVNPHGLRNSDVVKPSLNGAQILRRTHESFVIDFGVEQRIERAALYEMPFEYVRREIYPARKSHQEACQRKFWWLHARPSPRYRNMLKDCSRYVVTPVVSKHRVFVWMEPPCLVDHATVVFPRSDDCFFGVLHSRVHETWARALGTQVRERESGFRYTPTTCFETFPFPDATDGQRTIIGEAAAKLVQLRDYWLNPPEWTREEVLEFPGSADGPWKRFVQNPDARGIGTVRYPRLVPKNEECAAKLAKRTLTALYNQAPEWLVLAHRELDEAVLAAYDWKPSVTDDEILEGLLALNLTIAAGAGTQQEAIAATATS